MRRPTVLVDGIVFENRTQTGIWRVFYEVMTRTSQEIDYKLLLGSEAIQPIPEGADVISSDHRSSFRQRNIVTRMRRRNDIAKLARDFPEAIWHSTFFSPDPRPKGRCVVSVFDMTAEEHFLSYPEIEVQIAVKQKCLEHVDSVLVISNETKRLLLRYYPHLEQKVVVALLGCEHLKQRDYPPVSNPFLDQKYVLYIGNRQHYKNFGCLVRAVATSQWPNSLGVVVVGSPMSDNELNLLRKMNVDKRFRQAGYVTDEQMGELMRAANCFVFPSLSEGFGFATVEAQVNGCPVIASDLPIFREIAGEGAVYFNPNDAESLATQVQLLGTSIDRQQLIDRGHKNAQRFRWDDTASVTLKCYLDVWDSKRQVKR